jgi:hypothetical protein
MFLSQMVRQLQNEQNTINDSTLYQETSSSYVTKTSKQFTLLQAALVAVRVKFAIWNGAGAQRTISGAVAVKYGSVPILYSGLITISLAASASQSYELETFISLVAGTYTLDFQLAAIQSGGYGWIEYDNIQIGTFSFADTDLTSGDSGVVSAPNAQATTVETINITTYPTRKLPCGKLQNTNLIILVSCHCDTDNSQSKMKNPGETNDAVLNWKLYLNGVQQSWSDRQNDNGASPKGTRGRFTVPVVPGTGNTIRLDVYNNIGSSKNVRAFIAVLHSPWVIGDNPFYPINLSLSQQSTLYVTLEPFTRDPTKSLKIGLLHAATFGDSTDYYHSSGGTSIIADNYVFESVPAENIPLQFSGLMACISIIGADVR